MGEHSSSLRFELNVKVGKGETLGFGNENSTLTLGYFIGKKSSALCYLDRNNAAFGKLRLRDNNNMLVGVKGVRAEDPQLNELKEKLQGKYLSVFGASMCTYIGYSNDATTNTTNRKYSCSTWLRTENKALKMPKLIMRSSIPLQSTTTAI